ncbi:hypothetical protein H5410_055840 [Solanum commersonii]|uniref:Uncharacterized protein n=1 Tax=Solanum commersonii TaxID=4109 RepID=A0A9J5WJI8_SOLCO|nr:hypothetical protein H5410_055840 [Solanum commersonii]
MTTKSVIESTSVFLLIHHHPTKFNKKIILLLIQS